MSCLIVSETTIQPTLHSSQTLLTVSYSSLATLAFMSLYIALITLITISIVTFLDGLS